MNSTEQFIEPECIYEHVVCIEVSKDYGTIIRLIKYADWSYMVVKPDNSFYSCTESAAKSNFKIFNERASAEEFSRKIQKLRSLLSYAKGICS